MGLGMQLSAWRLLSYLHIRLSCSLAAIKILCSISQGKVVKEVKNGYNQGENLLKEEIK
jgi:hypothetical protein